MSNAANKCKSAKGCFRTDDMTCFYSGIKLRTEADDKLGLKASVEHLVPMCTKNQAYLGMQNNKVPCATVINQMIGSAPLSVKFALKDFFKGFTFHPAMSDKAIVDMMKYTMSIFLNDYQIHGMYVWTWKEYTGKKNVSDAKRLERRRELYDAYILLLTEEEKAIGAYKKWDLE